jgi:hypothetical protein
MAWGQVTLADKRMSDLYKHIREKAARKATDELARIRAEQRAAVRARLDQENKEELRANRASEVPLPHTMAPKKK